MRKNKKLFGLAILAVLVLFVWAGCDAGMTSNLDSGAVSSALIPTGHAASISQTSSFELLAGQSISSGAVTVAVTGKNLIVTYQAANGFVLNELHLWVGEKREDIPVNRSGNPVPGNFPYTASGLNTASYSFTVSLSAVGVEESDELDASLKYTHKFYGAAHAVVSRVRADGSVQRETAWAGVDRITAKGNWATFFSFFMDFEKEVTDKPKYKEVGTAFAVGDLRLNDYGLSERWGWIITVPGEGSYSTPLYAGAGRNDLSRGTLVGNLNYSFDGSKVSVEFAMIGKYVLEETHLYADAEFPITGAPGQFGKQNEFDVFASSDSYEVSVDGAPFYLIAHASVYVIE